ncbi:MULTISPECIES: phosphotransferase [Nocardiopsis]|uniref:phosphotransferase n=1 Tax=Nocardiopsis TaxID=2013 RepID=UPI0035CD1571
MLRGAKRQWSDRGVQDTAAVEWDRPAVWVHGGLHPANAVVAGGILAGVVDFGELCAGDPATDLSAAWLLLPAGAATRIFDAYAGAGRPRSAGRAGGR